MISYSEKMKHLILDLRLGWKVLLFEDNKYKIYTRQLIKYNMYTKIYLRTISRRILKESICTEERLESLYIINCKL